ncbi:MAG: WG repeat-containing protein [bacterium]|nr:WG repeat-containing protein [bacterium]
MAKSRNLVKRAKGGSTTLLVALLVVGWLLSGYYLVMDNTEHKQNKMIQTARGYLEDKLYIRAAKQYLSALNQYHTANNLTYEAELLAIYEGGCMMEEYYELIEDRIEEKTAALEEYRKLAEWYIENERVQKAIPVLQQGIQLYQDEELRNLYESNLYVYSPVSTTYQVMQLPSEDWYIPTFDGEHWGYVGKNGKTILNFAYEEATRFSGNYAVVKIDGVYTLIDKQGYWNAVDKNGLEEVTAILGNRIVGGKGGQYAIYSNTFQRVSEESYDKAYLSDNGMIAVLKDGTWKILDKNLKAVTEDTFLDVVANSKGQVFYKNYAVVADENGYYLINAKGEPYSEVRFTAAKGIEEGLVAVADESGLWGFANEKGEILIACQYEDANSFSNRLAAVKYAGQWGYINRYNQMMIEAQYEQAYPFLEGSALTVDELGNYKILSLKYYSLFE